MPGNLSIPVLVGTKVSIPVPDTTLGNLEKPLRKNDKIRSY